MMDRRAFLKRLAAVPIAVAAMPPLVERMNGGLVFHKDAFALIWPALPKRFDVIYGTLRPELACRVVSSASLLPSWRQAAKRRRHQRLVSARAARRNQLRRRRLRQKCSGRR